MTKTRGKRKAARAAIRLCKGPEGDKRWVMVQLPPYYNHVEHGPRLTLYETNVLVQSEGFVEASFVQTLVRIPWATLARALRHQGGEWQLVRKPARRPSSERGGSE